ncbi:T9SS type A sorting domain-containing protein [Aestuariibaculum sediminum]|uniref:T9SS type A sorting domain-containing protein n=1 Tax=Aestuariibaculum sediminum TaxID=2770637 RepID=A0A8J6PZ37_9FLAO|nr:T9SS type A sorting domain-containing protein [Aestuariibaculum sediminum]MBD0831548.1 T9SS type A sorting domain-containing protein [Aestuariibaculum sediminum]
MKKITNFILTAIIMVATNGVIAQNLIPDWDANGLTGAGTEANKWGFGSDGAVWGEANGGSCRYRDGITYNIEGGGTYGGRHFLYRWDGDTANANSVMSLGVPVNKGVTTEQAGIPMTGNLNYTITGYYAWLNNANAPTYEFGFGQTPTGTPITSASFEAPVREIYHPFTLNFTPTVSGDYFFQVRQIDGRTSGTTGNGGIILLANLSIEQNTLSINNATSPVSSNIKGIGNRVFVSDVKTATEIKIYSIDGSLIKTINTSNDMDFNFRSGLWIATLKTSEGQKSVKLLVK